VKVGRRGGESQNRHIARQDTVQRPPESFVGERGCQVAMGYLPRRMHPPVGPSREGDAHRLAGNARQRPFQFAPDRPPPRLHLRAIEVRAIVGEQQAEAAGRDLSRGS
jgi:hypothetical protein